MSRRGTPKLTRLLAILEPTRTGDGSGGYHEVWTELGRIWAEVLPRSGRERGEVSLPLSQADYRITVRAVAALSPQRPRPGQYLEEGSRRFEVLAVHERDADGRYLICFARETEVSR